MKRHYILNGLVFVEVESGYVSKTGNVVFKGHVFRYNSDSNSTDICGLKLKDGVVISLPENTPYINF